ncbi:MAG: excinuclease ABC subunit UvrA [candidate division KSB1 bacterium]|nr:excinuclease ABC subunit UvrA [candidate division KSB1 bacterium]MDZ7275699.1 excinuclease ABC subunit UvrA [candidate division KSB1 bacterium]MDZ7284610.1 excinuclease ABC subunit UvrA [candidate division KSB1 bacterium]MDZ7297971.1 excinuclease ABC subunit UvrA [candidate division KSB1 bacterium]MDZ7305861.1 excinuclease ABC subunit UvrA [candidate division KSB1 bacterium]
MAEKEYLVVKGAREHNLKNIDVEIPRNKLVVITGLSGSGKSSLAFDTIYAEGQRRYVESLSAYARQFLGLMEKPDLDYIEGLSPAISIEQKSSSRNPRSTVGTVTEIYDYLRLLFARIGVPHCYNCGRVIERQTVQQMVDAILALPAGVRFQVLAPVVRGRKGEYREIFDTARREGYVRVRVDGEVKDLAGDIKLDKNKKHNIEIVVDRLLNEPGIKTRLTDSLETALHLANGLVLIEVVNQREILFSEHFACAECGISVEELAPRLFSFNAPHGACPACNGLGTTMEVDPDLVVTNPGLSIREGALEVWGDNQEGWYWEQLKAVSRAYDFSLDTPWNQLKKAQQRVVLYGSGERELKFNYASGNGRMQAQFTGKFEGIIPNLQRRYVQTDSQYIRTWIEGFMNKKPCPACQGARLRPEALAVKIRQYNIFDITRMTVRAANDFFNHLALSAREQQIAHQILKEVRERLGFLVNVGLDYLTLHRDAGSLSGGEAQRIRLATQIGSQLVGVLYILDEPSIGLHQRDNRKLIDTLLRLRDLGNTVIVVEHDHETIASADWVIDLGPGAGKEGGRVVAAGPPAEVAHNTLSLTGDYLAGRRYIAIPAQRRPGNGTFLELTGAQGNNLKNLDVKFPLGLLICVTGVSGSGKSTLINETLYRVLARELNQAKQQPLPFRSLRGLQHLDKVIDIDQSPIGRTPRSNPATYTGLFTEIRDLFAQTQEAKIRGYKPGRFSFNVKGGRCENCEGDGIIKIEMHFLPDVYVTCEACKGRRYNRETLEIKYKGKSIAEVLDMTVDEALDFFQHIPTVKRRLQTLHDVGLGYIHLGQQATTLSGGEAQRVKLATELSRVATGRTIYILDEPTTGLHFEDVKMLLKVLNRLVDMGNSVIVIEHNLDVIKTADYIIDLGPEGGDNGGRVVAAGTPEDVAQVAGSYTGEFLRKILQEGRREARPFSMSPAPANGHRNHVRLSAEGEVGWKKSRRSRVQVAFEEDEEREGTEAGQHKKNSLPGRRPRRVADTRR